MFKETLRSAAYAVAPGFVVDRYVHHKMIAQARRLAELRDASSEADALFEPLWTSPFFRPLQKKSEMLGLLRLIQRRRPSAICEVGAAGCGTTFLLTQAATSAATIIAIDLDFTFSREMALKSFALPGQKLICLRQDSHQPETVMTLKNRLAGCSLDVLYLDGDHSYEGVKTDFELYSPLVAPGGIIVFHDIVPDFKSRYGIQTSSDVGGVPQFWQEIKASYRVEEIVEDYEQDGFGIGVLHWDGRAALLAANANGDD
jgi:predicted O-methyltransferase YrrM